MHPRNVLYRLIDSLPESEVEAARRFLEYLRDSRDPVLTALLSAPDDDEPETDEERASVSEARQDIQAGRIVSPKTIWNEIS